MNARFIKVKDVITGDYHRINLAFLISFTPVTNREARIHLANHKEPLLIEMTEYDFDAEIYILQNI